MREDIDRICNSKQLCYTALEYGSVFCIPLRGAFYRAQWENGHKDGRTSTYLTDH